MRSARAVTKKRLIDNEGVWPDVVINLEREIYELGPS